MASRRRPARYALPGSARPGRSGGHGFADGTVISPYYDSLIAKIIVWDESRPAAIARALRSLGELELEGIPTTRDLALDILRSEAVRQRRLLDELP